MQTVANKIKWSEEDQCYIATSEEYPDLLGTGDTEEEAEKMLLEMISDYIEDEKKGKVRRGRPVKDTVKLACRVSSDSKAYIDLYCLEYNLKPGSFIESLIQKHQEIHGSEIYT